MPLLLQTRATALPLTLDRVRQHLRLPADHTAEDDLLTGMIAAATDECEHKLGGAILQQQWAWVGPALAAQTPLARPPVSDIVSVTVAAPDGTIITLPPSAYSLVHTSDYTALCQLAGAAPASSGTPAAARIVFTTGYASAAAVPASIVSWLLLRVGDLYANREATSVGNGQAIVLPFDCLLDRYRLWGF